MGYFSKEQTDMLKEAEQYFRQAVYANYKRNTTVALNNKVADTYEEATGNRVNRDWSCGKCVFDVYRKVGQLYYDSIEHNNNMVTVELEPATENQEVNEEQSQTRKKRTKKNKTL